MLDQQCTPSPSFEPPNPREYFNKTSKVKQMTRNGRIVQSMVQNDFGEMGTKTEPNLKKTSESGLKQSLSRAKEHFELKMKKEEVGARWRGQGSVRVKRDRTVKRNKKKLQTKSVIKRRPRKEMREVKVQCCIN